MRASTATRSPGWAWGIFGVVWAIALFGIVFQILYVSRYPRFSTATYLLIAGSYTPFCLAAIRHYSPAWAWSIFGVVWAIALFGIVFQILYVSRYPRFSTATYLLMGWIVLIAVYPLWKAMGTVAVAWIAAGGLLYSLGVVFYAMKHIKYMHAIWHLFVLGGTLAHYGVILYYIALGKGQ